MIRSDQKNTAMNFQGPTLVIILSQSLSIFLFHSLNAHLAIFLFLFISLFHSPTTSISSSFSLHSTVPCLAMPPTVRSDQTTTHRPLLVLPSPSSSSRQKPVSCFPKKYSPQPQAFTVREISNEYRLSNFFPQHKCNFGRNADSRRIY